MILRDRRRMCTHAYKAPYKPASEPPKNAAPPERPHTFTTLLLSLLVSSSGRYLAGLRSSASMKMPSGVICGGCAAGPSCGRVWGALRPDATSMPAPVRGPAGSNMFCDSGGRYIDG
eukprot:365523-Chlamydomonas_euryale.AAC.9